MSVKTKLQVSKNMRSVRSTGSDIEIALSKQLWKSGIRYRKNDKSVFGRPDLTIKRHRIAIFVDGDFWHGRDWSIRKKEHKTNKEFWHNKIERNIARDIEVNKNLIDSGWTVLRFWGSDILKNTKNCSDLVIKKINESKRKGLV